MARDPINGVVLAVVADNRDPDNEGRIAVTFPWLKEDHEPRWLPVAAPMAGGGRGMYVMPEIDDEVLVAFDHGDFDHGFVVGFLWNPVQRPPVDSPDARVVTSREGHSISLLDAEEREGNRGALIIKDAHDNVLTMTNGVVSLVSRGLLVLEGGTVIIKGRIVNPVGGVI
jgi:phage baseplate assembly protein V